MPGPPLNRQQVAATLKRLRTATELSQRQVAERTSIGEQSNLVRYEGARHVPTAAVMAELADFYGADPFTRAELLASAREHQGGRQQQVVMQLAATTAQRRIEAAEKAATRVVTFSPLIIPGLLQAPLYARAVGATQLAGAELESWLAARLSRQAGLLNPGNTRYELYTTAGALAWALGGRDAMMEQLGRLDAATRATTYEFGLVPAGAPAEQFALHALDLIETAENQLIHFGTHSGVVTVTDPAHQAEAHRVLREVRRLAVFGAEARAELERASALYR